MALDPSLVSVGQGPRRDRTGTRTGLREPNDYMGRDGEGSKGRHGPGPSTYFRVRAECATEPVSMR